MKTQTRLKMLAAGLLAVSVVVSRISAAQETRPNILVILADDMGIDCVASRNEKSGIPTPNMDRLIRQGMLFTDAHSASAVCSPSRYALLTGRYAWRSRLKRGIVGQWERSLIEPGRLTLPAMLKQKGYTSACIGKWHLGWEWPRKGKKIDFSRPLGRVLFYAGAHAAREDRHRRRLRAFLELRSRAALSPGS